MSWGSEDIFLAVKDIDVNDLARQLLSGSSIESDFHPPKFMMMVNAGDSLRTEQDLQKLKGLLEKHHARSISGNLNTHMVTMQFDTSFDSEALLQDMQHAGFPSVVNFFRVFKNKPSSQQAVEISPIPANPTRKYDC